MPPCNRGILDKFCKCPTWQVASPFAVVVLYHGWKATCWQLSELHHYFRPRFSGKQIQNLGLIYIQRHILPRLHTYLARSFDIQAAPEVLLSGYIANTDTDIGVRIRVQLDFGFYPLV